MRLIDEGIEVPLEPSKDLGDTFSGRLRIRRRAASTAIIDKGICIATTYTKDGNQSPIKQGEDAVNVAQWLCKAVNEYSETRSQLAALKEESERLKDEYLHLFNKRAGRVENLQKAVWAALDRSSCPGIFLQIASHAIHEHGCAEIADLKKALEQSQARVAELEDLVRDIKQHDINEAAKRILEDGLKLNYSLPLSIRERIASALKEPANEG